ncbi:MULTISPECIES: hypothetical protein [Myxococcus]|uniref:Lipoprotein n=1 Tax=Myxococcus xanthus TaxID=34 RepID=A0AAE6FX88_MYXXA|nr:MULTISPECIES: hypothetical protein [Myxococcus]QDE66827.1 hypothetical protein BHS09_07250 [Myxococcus xanthus]QDE74100.1 hypothetical protein BHS08_07255 [Myxococcus xanthus]QDE81365.1 hypothetical protein BHS07_07145 [Myxococcus xanthus]QDE95695.1 hypothetical protein BHS05_07265 [Myxococcus xanthus]QDF02999.1 hypothetical protein BHS04_07155 [Myxococcus xanthus]
MKKLLIGLVASSALAFGTGCGGGDDDLCEDLYNSSNEVDKKGRACGVTGLSDNEMDAAIQQCKSGLDKCTDSDKEKIERAVKCLDGVNTCSEGNEMQYFGELIGCAAQLSGISEACRAAVTVEDLDEEP